LASFITDGWRSIDQQTDLYTSFYPNGHVEGEPLYVSPSNTEDRFASPHPSGGAVDVLIGIGDQAIRIGSDLDYMDVEANTDHFENELYEGHIIKMMRRLFSNLKCEVGFVTLDSEWWHVEYGTRRWAGKTGQDPLYGNATIDLSLYEGIEPVVPIARSRRAAMSS
jgi:D-alanyl-D-alanine dipeptidase